MTSILELCLESGGGGNAMTRRICLIWFAAFILFFFSAALVADVIVLKSGKVIEGEIVEETGELVAIELDGGTGFFSKEDIKSINKTRLDVASGRIVETTTMDCTLVRALVSILAAAQGRTVSSNSQLHCCRAMTDYAGRSVEPDRQLASSRSSYEYSRLRRYARAGACATEMTT